MVKKKENLLVLGLISLCIALTLETLGNHNIMLSFIIIIFIGITIFSSANYIVINSLENKKKKPK